MKISFFECAQIFIEVKLQKLELFFEKSPKFMYKSIIVYVIEDYDLWINQKTG